MAGTRRQVVLTPMTRQEFVPYREAGIRKFAQDKVRSGDWSEQEALALSERDHDQLLSDGIDTPGQSLFIVRDADLGEPVATLWLMLRLKAGRIEAYVYDIEVIEKYRGQGYGRATMLAGIERARDLGAETVGLHVFGHNATARTLYQSLGFIERHVSMTLEL